MDATEPLDAGSEAPLLRAVVGYRIFATVWLCVLGSLILAGRGGDPDQPEIVVVTMAVVAAFTAFAVIISARRPSLLASPWFIVLDVAVAIFSMVAADWAGTVVFAGGYPTAAIFGTIYSRGTWPGMAVAIALSLSALLRFPAVTGLNAADISLVIVYPFVAAAAAWAFAVVRSSDRARRRAEQELIAERTERARAEERTAMAARIHDSVLQTLALIQRQADNPRKITNVARRQERELRSWLYGNGAPDEPGFREALQEACAEVEDVTGVKADLVVVGNRNWDEAVEAIVLAGREAMVNAAKHADVTEVSVYGEATGDSMAIYVRDRGKGFVPGQVDVARRGIEESIIGRVEHHGGRATITSQPGAGTEVRLEWEDGST
jgi:signal transduction histidine kinase